MSITTTLKLSREKGLFLVISLVGNFGLLLVDHIHFQYNGLIIGISLLFLSELSNGNILTAALIFAFMLNLKHLFLYVAPFVGIYMLSVISNPKSIFESMLQLVKLASAVVFVFVLSFGPFASKDQIIQIFTRLFPVSRGLTHSYWAGNIWALYNAVDIAMSKFLKIGKSSNLTSGLLPRSRGDNLSFNVLPEISPRICVILMLISIIPMLRSVWKSPKGKEIQGYYVCALASFIFGYHVHEKAILISLIPLTVLAIAYPQQFGRDYLILSSAGYSGLLPLIFTHFEQPFILGLFGTHQLFIVCLFIDNFRECSILEKMYILISMPVVCYVQTWSKFIHPALPFLSLIVQSCYSAVGVIYAFISANATFCTA